MGGRLAEELANRERNAGRSRREIAVLDNDGADFVLAGGNRVLLGIQVLTIAFLAATVTIPPVRRLFGFGPLHLHDAAMVALACGLLGMTLALLRWLGRRWSRTGPLQRTGRR